MPKKARVFLTNWWICKCDFIDYTHWDLTNCLTILFLCRFLDLTLFNGKNSFQKYFRYFFCFSKAASAALPYTVVSIYCRCSRASPCSTAAWIDPWQMVEAVSPAQEWGVLGTLGTPPSASQLYCERNWGKHISGTSFGTLMGCFCLKFVLKCVWYSRRLISVMSQ